MISNISFYGIIRPHTFSKSKVCSFSHNNGTDTFEKTKSSLAETIAYAKNKIIEIINQENAEYSFIISPDGEITGEEKGTENQCGINEESIKPNSIIIHGHPEPLPLSSGDVSILLSTDLKTMEAVTSDGKYSRLTKKHPFKTEKSYNRLYPELEKQLRIGVLENMGIDCKLRREHLINMFKDFMGINHQSEISDEAISKEALKYGINMNNEDLEETQTKLHSLMAYQLMFNPHKYDRIHNLLIEKNELINQYLNTPEGIEARHKFLQNIADKYDLIYETNMYEE